MYWWISYHHISSYCHLKEFEEPVSGAFRACGSSETRAGLSHQPVCKVATWALGRVTHVKIPISNGFPINKIKLLSNVLITINKGNEGWGGSVLIVCLNKNGRQGKTCQDSTLLWFRHKGHWDESWAALTAVMSMELAPWTFFRRVDYLSESWSKLLKNFFFRTNWRQCWQTRF